MSRVPEGCPLSPRQWDALQGLAFGETDAETAVRLHIGESTLRTHRIHLRKKLGVKTSAQAAALGASKGWLVGDPVEFDQEKIDSPLTPGQQLYVEGFDQLLRSRDTFDRSRAERLLNSAYRTVCLEAEIPDRRGHDHRLPTFGYLDRLLGDLLF